jgi:predicted Zn-dependent peptidase
VSTVTLDNHVRLAIIDRPELPVVSVTVAVLHEPEEPSALRATFADLLPWRPTAKYSARYLDGIGLRSRPLVANGVAGSTMTVLSPFLADLFEHVAAQLRSAEYSDLDVDVTRRDAIATYLAPNHILSAELSSLLFPGKAYGEALREQLTGYERMDRATLRRFHERNVVGARLFVAIVGDVRATRVEALAREHLGRIPPGAPVSGSIVPAP